MPPKPTFLGTQCIRRLSIEELCDYIDWTPFFQTWELTGKFPAILDEQSTAQPRAAFTTMRRRCSTRSSTSAGSSASAVLGFWPANARRRRYSRLRRRDARQADRACCTRCASNCRKREGRANAALVGFYRAARQRPCRLYRRLRGHRRALARTRLPSASSAPMTTTPRSW